MTRHHPSFHEFPLPEEPVPHGFDRDFLGVLTRLDFEDRKFNPGYPEFEQHYFEWIALLESVLDARDRYTLIELGAAYGVWSVRAAVAIRRRFGAMPVRLIAVEADPFHFDWMKLHFSDNRLRPEDHTLLHAAVSAGGRSLPFLVRSPEGTERPNTWFGQALADWAGEVVEADAGEYGGRTVRLHENGWGSIAVPQITLPAILDQVDRADLLHMDIQGMEYEVLNSAIDSVTSKVRRIAAATHSREIDNGLRALLVSRGWQCAAAYAPGETAETSWGQLSFADGVQVWLNPNRLC